MSVLDTTAVTRGPCFLSSKGASPSWIPLFPPVEQSPPCPSSVSNCRDSHGKPLPDES